MAHKFTQDKLTDASPESVAYQLMTIVIALEKKEMEGGYPQSADRKWLLDTFAECLGAAKGHRIVEGQ